MSKASGVAAGPGKKERPAVGLSRQVASVHRVGSWACVRDFRGSSRNREPVSARGHTRDSDCIRAAKIMTKHLSARKAGGFEDRESGEDDARDDGEARRTTFL